MSEHISASFETMTGPTGSIVDFIGAARKSKEGASGAIMFIAGFIGVIVLGIISLVVYGFIYTKSRKEEMQKNWPDYRCKPQVIPIAGMVGPPGTDTTENFKACMEEMTGNFVYQLMKPVFGLFSGVFDMIQSLKNSIQQMRMAIFSIRENMRKTSQNLFRKLKLIYAMMGKLVKRVQQILMYIFLTLRNLFYTLKYVYWMVMALWNGPIGGLVRTVNGLMSAVNSLRGFFCFHPRQHIPYTLPNHTKWTTYPMEYIPVGAMVNPSSPTPVIGKMTTLGDGDWYQVAGWVTNGYHPVWDPKQHTWLHYPDPAHPSPYQDGEKRIVCLWTESGVIQGTANDSWAMDFWGPIVHDARYKYMARMYNSLSSNPVTLHTWLEKLKLEMQDEKNVGWSGGFFPSFAQVQLDDGTWQNITKVRLGDRLYGGGTVRSIAEIADTHLQWFEQDGFMTTRGCWSNGEPLILSHTPPSTHIMNGYGLSIDGENSCYTVRMNGQEHTVQSWTGPMTTRLETIHEIAVQTNLPTPPSDSYNFSPASIVVS